jgi:hypothetical protein
MAMFARLLAPTASDSEFMGELVSELSGRNDESINAQMREGSLAMVGSSIGMDVLR